MFQAWGGFIPTSHSSHQQQDRRAEVVNDGDVAYDCELFNLFLSMSLRAFQFAFVHLPVSLSVCLCFCPSEPVSLPLSRSL